MQTETQGQTAVIQGRVIWVSGDFFSGKKLVDAYTKQPKIDQKTQLQMVEYGVGLAVPKAELQPGQQGADFWAKLVGEAQRIFPNGFPPDFAWKFKDGDTAVDKQGQPYSKRPGYAGCYVFSLTTRIPIRYFKYDAAQRTNIQVDQGLRNGDYFQFQVQMKAHPAVGQGKAGMYLNPLLGQWIAFGEEIVNTVNADSVFGNNAPNIPVGGMATPPAQNYGGMMQTPGVAQPPAGGQGQYAPPGAMPGMPGPQVQQQAPAHYGTLPAHLQQPPAAQYGPPTGMPGPAQYPPQGNGAMPPGPQAGYNGTAGPGFQQQPGMPPMAPNGMPLPR